MTAPDDAIRARRKLTNKLIAAKDAARLRPFLAKDVNLITGDGSLISGVEAVVAAFAGQFRDPAFVNYVRTSGEISLDQSGDRAAEQGAWTALWRTAGQDQTMSGTYLACWRKVTGQWVIESELYITLAEDQPASR
ncbi:YybH family protein [Phenylobacterium aquaticum]|uniref:YybH family protein n=1 Tax=Phenylobacterium aquaticum TaxID=1763816 RepID=UPI001F5D2775|nr:nuclear transport factor 2 family protein [Phenylobacterium aquaticum]MCI3134612.1 nuclear transport factor 2 family protein [Phenylobacterium aquaticum]